MRHFIGGGVELADAHNLHSDAERHRLRTVPTGVVHLQLGLIFRDFKKFGIEY